MRLTKHQPTSSSSYLCMQLIPIVAQHSCLATFNFLPTISANCECMHRSRWVHHTGAAPTLPSTCINTSW